MRSWVMALKALREGPLLLTSALISTPLRARSQVSVLERQSRTSLARKVARAAAAEAGGTAQNAAGAGRLDEEGAADVGGSVDLDATVEEERDL